MQSGFDEDPQFEIISMPEPKEQKHEEQDDKEEDNDEKE